MTSMPYAESRHHDPVGETITGGADALRDQVDDLVTQTERAVREDPVRALLIALAAGWLFRRLHVTGLLSVILRLAVASLVPALVTWGARELFRTVGSGQTSRRDDPLEEEMVGGR
jgi:hypothetical protein